MSKVVEKTTVISAVRVKSSVIERARNAVAAIPGLTLQQLVSDSLEAKMDDLERIRGGEFPQREKNLNGSKKRKKS